MNRSEDEGIRVVQAWLGEGSTELSNRVRDGVLNEFRLTPQERPVWTTQGRTLSTFAMFVVAAAVVAVLAVVGFSLLDQRGNVGGPPTSVVPSRSPATTREPKPSPSPSDFNPGSVVNTIGRHSVTVEGVPISFDIGAAGWEIGPASVTVPPAGLHLRKNVSPGQGAEGIVYWTGFPYGTYTSPCARIWGPQLMDPQESSSIADIAMAVSTAAGTELVTGPTDVSVGGLPAKYVEVRVREDLGCDPGYFHVWLPPDPSSPYRGAFWLTPGVGATISVWILDVDGTQLFIAGETHVGDGATDQELEGLRREIDQIVDSIQFD